MKRFSRAGISIGLPALLLGVILGACSGKYGEREKIETIEGRISVRGSAPTAVLLLEAGERTYLVRSEELEEELAHLQGMAVSLVGKVGESRGSALPVLAVRSYRLLPLSGGEVPEVGMLEVEKNGCFLLLASGRRLALTGELVSVLREYPGAKVWVVGPIAGDELEVRGYGIILEPRER